MLAIFNSLGGGEVIVILVLALIVLGPEKLPEAMRRFGNIYSELRRMSDGFQSELRDAFQEPMQELRGTAQMMQDAVSQPMQAMTDPLREPATTATQPEAAADEVQTPVDEPPDVGDGRTAGPDEGASGDPGADAVEPPEEEPEPGQEPEQEPMPTDIGAPVLPTIDPDVVAPLAEASGVEGIADDPARERPV